MRPTPRKRIKTMAYNIENATYQDYRDSEFQDLAGHAWVKFNDMDMSAEEFYITDIRNVNANNTEYLGKCKDMAELETLARKWADD
jgi:predicted PolB exonuclease-like 3'-5' exonuclease